MSALAARAPRPRCFGGLNSMEKIFSVGGGGSATRTAPDRAPWRRGLDCVRGGGEKTRLSDGAVFSASEVLILGAFPGSRKDKESEASACSFEKREAEGRCRSTKAARRERCVQTSLRARAQRSFHQILL
eukprot:scaffold447_cov307-Pinguiococcus_pyrenoidosus.AAC.12